MMESDRIRTRFPGSANFVVAIWRLDGFDVLSFFIFDDLVSPSPTLIYIGLSLRQAQTQGFVDFGVRRASNH
jgi:hypothetical protein